MEGRAGLSPKGTPPLIGRQHVLQVFDECLTAVARGSFQFLGLVGEPGAGKTRLLAELATAADAHRLPVLWGRAAEYEQQMPFGMVIDALDDHLETRAERLPDTLGPAAMRSLASVFPSLSAAQPPGEAEVDTDHTGLARYRLYRVIRQLLDELARPSGVVLILDDGHWADDSSVELLDHLVRHPVRGKVLIAVSYRPAQVSSRLATLVESAVQAPGSQGRLVPVGPLNEAEVAQFLGPAVSRSRRRALYEASGGNPFYLEALSRIGQRQPSIPVGEEESELPRAVQAALQVELDALSPDALLVARAAAVAADEFEPGLAAVTAEISEEAALAAIDELVARDVVRPAGSAGRFVFRHPLVRHAAYNSAAAGWRLGVHARIAAHLAELGAPATAQAPHVERSARLGDQAAVDTLAKAARSVSAQAPATAAHWFTAALRLIPGDRRERPELMLELATAQAVSGQIPEGRDTARETLRLLAPDDFVRRARAARICAIMERMLGRPHQARTVLLDELHRISDPRSPAAVTLRLRLVADNLVRSDFRAAQAVLDLMPDDAPGWAPSLRMATAGLRPLPALAAGRFTDAVSHIDIAVALIDAAPDEHLAEWLDVINWLCWTETMMGRHQSARRRFERALVIARSTGQSYLVPYLFAGQARCLVMLGRLPDAVIAAEEAAEVARVLGTGQELVMALIQQSLVASWMGDDDEALRLAAEAMERSKDTVEWWGAMAQYARALALINAGQTEAGAGQMMAACNGFRSPKLDPATLMSCCELMARTEAERDRPEQAAQWARRAGKLAHPGVEASIGLAQLTQAHADRHSDPGKAGDRAREAAERLRGAELRIDYGRAKLTAGLAYAEAGERNAALEELRAAAEIFAACGARSLHAQTVREQRRLGVRVHTTTSRSTGPHGLSGREFEVAALVAEGCTNHQIAERLFISDRTVETHLSRIFAKLGVSSRVGVVSALSQRDRD
ncbi:MAG TPA: AAA family ATPase [Streptosporangiaceae bacterium]|jgi:DNA-binding CsgD family transcriptional regulator|nr:AAA family ATPase [Streptosporangiaceae bacterium]